MALHWKFTAEKILLVKIPKRARTTTANKHVERTESVRDTNRASVLVSVLVRARLCGCPWSSVLVSVRDGALLKAHKLKMRHQ